MSDSSTPEAKRPWFDPTCAVLMALATLGTAWCSYQSSNWSGQASDLEATADKRQREVVALHLEARQYESVQIALVMEVIDAKLSGNERLEKFYISRFPDDVKVAWDKWIALKPFDNPSAPPHPFVPSLYTPRFQAEVNAAAQEAAQAEDRSHAVGQHASSYLGITVLLATVLFFAGSAGGFDHHRVRWSSLGFSIALFTFAFLRLVKLPVA